ncbi:hypothetical protein KKD49_12720 [Myxococcota bacterium]|nr:hypothetical protein [Myxococcota bacterium]
MIDLKIFYLYRFLRNVIVNYSKENLQERAPLNRLRSNTIVTRFKEMLQAKAPDFPVAATAYLYP